MNKILIVPLILLSLLFTAQASKISEARQESQKVYGEALKKCGDVPKPREDNLADRCIQDSSIKIPDSDPNGAKL